MSFMKGFFSLFDWMMPKTMEEQLNDLDDSMQRLYDRMGWGKYCSNSNCMTHADVDKLFEVQEKKYHNVFVKDPARPRRTFYERKYYER